MNSKRLVFIHTLKHTDLSLCYNEPTPKNMRLETFAKNKYYHVFDRGIKKQNIFLDDQDKARFIFLITHFQSPIRIFNVSFYTNAFVKKGCFNTKDHTIKKLLDKRNVELMAFVLMPNNFHLLIKNLEEGILSVYMHRVLTAYGKYFNAKYYKVGQVFDGSFKTAKIKNNDQLAYLADYLHQAPSIFVKRSFKTVGFAEPFVSFIP